MLFCIEIKLNYREKFSSPSHIQVNKCCVAVDTEFQKDIYVQKGTSGGKIMHFFQSLIIWLENVTFLEFMMIFARVSILYSSNH